MNKSKKLRAPVQTNFAAVIASVVIGGLGPLLYADEPKTNTMSQTNSEELKATLPDTKKAEIKKQLTGAELYSIHCNRCHAERYPTERTGAQWKTIMLHMQVRANIPGQQARLILQYLQENSGR